MDHSIFADNDNWCGSFYELSIELGPTGDDERLLAALNRLWSSPDLSGPWSNRNDVGGPTSPFVLSDGWGAHRFGLMDVAPGVRTGCGSCIVREPDGADWLNLYVPTGMLEQAFPVNYPLLKSTNPWLAQLDRRLASIGARVYESCRFRLAVIGEEVSGCLNSNSLTTADCEKRPWLLPAELWKTVAPVCAHREIAPGLMAVSVDAC